MAKITTDFVLRPFEGLPSEPDWVAFREIVPAATATAKTTAKYGGIDVVVATVLPGGFSALKRSDGVVMLGVQGALSAGDLSRDLAQALLAVADAEPGTAAIAGPSDGPRLQDVLDLKAPFEVTVHDGYDYWGSGEKGELGELIEEESEIETVPTVKLSSIDHAYWCLMGKPFLRWARPEDEDTVVNAIARLHAKRESALCLEGGEEARFLGMFRAVGLVVPVWELPEGTEAKDVEKPAAELAKRFTAAAAVTNPLDANERRARAGIVSRQVTLR